MKKNILVVTSSIDCTVDKIIEKHNNTIVFFRLNVDKLDNYKISIESNKNIWSIINIKTNENISKKEVFSIYYRKPMFPNLSDYELVYHTMIQRDIICLINGIVDSFDGKVLSKPCILRESENKANQLIYALKNNWDVPFSFIGNDSEKQQNFTNDKSIIKPLTTGKVYTDNGCELYQTNYFYNNNDDISLTPIYLQNYVQKQYEVRITVINKNIYTIRIDTKNKLDWRKDYENHKYSIIECPDKIKHNCFSMLENYNLQFGAFDYIVTQKNEWIFLELNPNGQWLWLEEALNLDISEKLIKYLLGE